MRASVLAAAAACVVAFPAAAQAKPLGNFVPAGFKVEHKVTGDFDGDGTADAALVVKRTGNYAKQHPQAQDRRLLVARGNGGSDYTLVGDGRKVLLCSTCGGAFYGLLSAPVTLKSVGGRIIIEQTSGARDVYDQTLRFWIKNGKTYLIGYDVTDTDRAVGTVTTVSTNLITGDRTRERTPPKGKTTKSTSKVKAGTPELSKVKIEDLF